MANYELISFDNPLALARAAAEAWITQIEGANRGGSAHRVALSGGRIARHFFSAAVEGAEQRRISFDRVAFFWADERCVPPADPESNFGLARKWLLEPLRVSPNQIHRIRGEIQPEEAAREAAADLRRVAAVNPAGQPVLDLVLLGMGEDGHIASLFPDSATQAIETAGVYCAVTAPKPPPHRVTLTYPSIAAAHDVWVLASGAGKTEALRNSLLPSGQTPLGRVLEMRQHTTIFSDA